MQKKYSIKILIKMERWLQNSTIVGRMVLRANEDVNTNIQLMN